MNTFEDQLRVDLADLADEVRPVPMLHRLDREAARVIRRRRLTVAAVAAAAVAVVSAGGSLLLAQIEQPRIIEPLQRPPKVFRLADADSTSPGRSLMAVVLARPFSQDDDGIHEDPLYLLPADGSSAIHLPDSERVPDSYTHQLSADGTILVRMSNDSDDPSLEMTDLVTGSSTDLGGRRGYCPQLSPDHATVAAYGMPNLALLDVGSGAVRTLMRRADRADGDCGLGWSPDGRLLVARTGEDSGGSVVIDRDGTVLHRLPGSYAVTDSMSWSPDGRSLLMYRTDAGVHELLSTEDGTTRTMSRPADALRPLGWAGSRVVWLAGAPGGYRLITTDLGGNEVRTWMTFDIGDRPIESVTWSRDLGGTVPD